MALLYAVIASFEGTVKTKYLSWASGRSRSVAVGLGVGVGALLAEVDAVGV